jgi:hypothetical protein
LNNYDGNNEEWEQLFSADYIRDYINVIKSEFLLWESNPSKLSIISPLNEKESQFYLVGGLKQ